MAYYYNEFAKKFIEYTEVSTFIPTFDLDKFPTFGNSVWSQQKSIMEQVLVSVRMLISSIESNLDFVNAYVSEKISNDLKYEIHKEYSKVTMNFYGKKHHGQNYLREK